MKKQTKISKDTSAQPETLNWKHKREMISKSMALEVDLENREIFFQPDLKERLRFDFGTNNIDYLIQNYVDPKDLKSVTHSLSLAKEGRETPIPFIFVHPLTAKRFKFEYRYQIVYVKYASTRLHGELVKLNAVKTKSKSRSAGAK